MASLTSSLSDTEVYSTVTNGRGTAAVDGGLNGDCVSSFSSADDCFDRKLPTNMRMKEGLLGLLFTDFVEAVGLSGNATVWRGEVGLSTSHAIGLANKRLPSESLALSTSMEVRLGE